MRINNPPINPNNFVSVEQLALKLGVNQNLADLSDPYDARSNIGLGNVDNTSDANKPLSNDMQEALDLKVNTTGDAVLGQVTADGLIVVNTFTFQTESVSAGLNDSAGAGFRVLKIPNS